MMKRGGAIRNAGGLSDVMPGDMAIECPACPHPDKNLPPDWNKAPKEKR